MIHSDGAKMGRKRQSVCNWITDIDTSITFFVSLQVFYQNPFVFFGKVFSGLDKCVP